MELVTTQAERRAEEEDPLFHRQADRAGPPVFLGTEGELASAEEPEGPRGHASAIYWSN
jgi:hypothetical protein